MKLYSLLFLIAGISIIPIEISAQANPHEMINIPEFRTNDD